MRWYLAGPIGNVTDGSDVQWREAAKRELDCIDPFDEERDLWPGERLPGEKPKDVMNRLRAAEDVGKIHAMMQEVLALDEASVRKADGILAYCPEATWGTIREVVIAVQMGKPVVVWTPAVGLAMSNTMIALASHVVHTFADAIVACRKFGAGRTSEHEHRHP